MYVPFEQMKDSSRLWVYQSNRFLSDEEANYLKNAVSDFLENWTAHGHPLLCSFLLEENVFLILAVDEESYSASGCSIDSSVHALKGIQQQIGVDLFLRDFVVFKAGDTLVKVPLTEIKSKAAAGEIGPDSLVFNTLVDSKAKLNNEWLVPAGSTWLKRYFKTVNTFQ